MTSLEKLTMQARCSELKRRPTLSVRRKLALYHNIFVKLRHLSNVSSTQEARQLGAKINLDAVNKLSQLGIDIQLHNYIQQPLGSEPVLYVGNHQAFALESWLAYYYLHSNTRIFAKAPLFNLPFVGKALKQIDAIKVPHLKQKEVDAQQIKNILKACRETLNARSESLLIYPEGTRSLNGALQNFTPLFKHVLKTYLQNVASRIIVVTIDSMPVIPYSAGDFLSIFTNPIPQAPIHIYMHEINPESKNQEQITQQIYNTMKNTLADSLRSRINAKQV